MCLLLYIMTWFELHPLHNVLCTLALPSIRKSICFFLCALPVSVRQKTYTNISLWDFEAPKHQNMKYIDYKMHVVKRKNFSGLVFSTLFYFANGEEYQRYSYVVYPVGLCINPSCSIASETHNCAATFQIFPKYTWQGADLIPFRKRPQLNAVA